MDKEEDKIAKSYENSQYDECIYLADLILKTDSTNYIALSHKAGSLLKISQYRKAIDVFSECIKIDDKKYHIWTLRGDCYYELKDYRKAYNDYLVSSNLDPSIGATMDRCARTLFLLGEDKMAIKYIKKAIKFADSPEPILIMIYMLRELKYINYAKQICNDGIRLFPSSKEKFVDYIERDFSIKE